MNSVKEINIKKCKYYFFKDMINIFKIDEKSQKIFLFTKLVM